jgi:hypothetical protein
VPTAGCASAAHYCSKIFFTSPILRRTFPPAFSAVPRSRKSGFLVASPAFSFALPFASLKTPLILSFVLDFIRTKSRAINSAVVIRLRLSTPKRYVWFLNARRLKNFQRYRCGLISTTVIAHSHEWLRDKTLRLTPHVQVQQRAQRFIGMDNEAPSVVAVRVCNKDCLPAGIDCCDTAPTETDSAKPVGSPRLRPSPNTNRPC